MTSFVPKKSPKGTVDMSVLDFFIVATNRMGSWNELNNPAAKLNHAKSSGHNTKDKDLEDEVKGLLEFSEVFESF